MSAAGNSAKLYIFRKQTLGTLMEYPRISVNDIEVGKLPNKKYVECDIPLGNIKVSSTFGDAYKEISFYAEPDQVYYVKCDATMKAAGIGVSLGIIRNQNHDAVAYIMNLARTTDEDGQEKIKKCKEEAYADLTKYVDPTAPMYAQQDTEGTGSTIAVSVPKAVKKASPISDVDKNIPMTNTENNNTFVLIVANEDYTFVDNVPFALNDGSTFKEYCIKTLGIPEKQIWMYENASLGILSSGVNKMVQAMEIFDNANAIIYYCGHGIPDEKTGDAYIVPVDGNGTDVTSCYSLNKLYKTLSGVKKGNVTYFLDACFTGAGRDGSMLVAARGVAREAKKEVINGNTVVFSAASNDETAMPYNDKGHGLFTYFLLKKLQETKGNVSYGELAEYIKENVKKESFLTNSKPQNPVVATSENLTSDWKNMKFK